MKTLQVSLFTLLCILVTSCMHESDNINISYSNSDQYYSMNAYFSKSKMRDVEEYLDRRIGRRSNMSFRNTRIDGTITLDDRTKFYIQKAPGMLKIKMDKDENSEEAYHRLKYMCEGIKSVVTSSRPSLRSGDGG